ncbi:uncharacterized protein LY89DRAFT_470714 [Mollisia scopiformis]|uniref:Uncharacterized protein n=1 Tax=Mollisia scopiformis TaxID=149040 RepID=A0A194XJ06_MOLSC|nr:uncharacterized protein LY89DRAFT_470714 [Mollisia scopiformis]KUJ20104.1 hypothetical protein LY89DRAFT_470714 [Mollisia scopiformis]
MYTTTILGLAVLAGTATANVYEAALAARQTSSDETAYLDSVCLPNVTSPVVPPCQEITNIESACLPNGTSSLDLLAHAECMCGGSYFSDWLGCLNCDFVHSGRSPAVTSAFHTILSEASTELCTGTPTASFQAIFSSLQYNVAANGSATDTTDLYPSQTAVSLYFTPSGVQGPGAITGSATLATKTGSVAGITTATGTAVSSQKSSGSGSSASAGSGGSSSSTSSSKAGAAPTGVWMSGLGIAAGVVGMVVL